MSCLSIFCELPWNSSRTLKTKRENNRVICCDQQAKPTDWPFKRRQWVAVCSQKEAAVTSRHHFLFYFETFTSQGVFEIWAFFSPHKMLLPAWLGTVLKYASMSDRVTCQPAGLPVGGTWTASSSAAWSRRDPQRTLTSSLCQQLRLRDESDSQRWSEELLSQQSESPGGGRERGGKWRAGLSKATRENRVRKTSRRRQTEGRTVWACCAWQSGGASETHCHWPVVTMWQTFWPSGAPVTGPDRCRPARW